MKEGRSMRLHQAHTVKEWLGRSTKDHFVYWHVLAPLSPLQILNSLKVFGLCWTRLYRGWTLSRSSPKMYAPIDV